MAKKKTRRSQRVKKGNDFKDILFSVFTGILIFYALALLLHPDITAVKATWATFYGDF